MTIHVISKLTMGAFAAGLLAAVGCGNANPQGSTGPEPASSESTTGTVLASFTTANGHTFEFIELHEAYMVVAESTTADDKPMIDESAREKSLAGIFRMLQPNVPVPPAILDADARLANVKATRPAAVPGAPPEGPAFENDHTVRFYDSFYDQFCAPSDNVYCKEQVSGTQNGPWAWGTWFQTAAWVDPRSCCGGTLALHEWQCPPSGCFDATVFTQHVAPANYWYLTHWIAPGTYHRGTFGVDSSSTLVGGFAERSDPPTVTATQTSISTLDFVVSNFWGESRVDIYLKNLPNGGSHEVGFASVTNGYGTGSSSNFACSPGQPNPGANQITVEAQGQYDTADEYPYVQRGCF